MDFHIADLFESLADVLAERLAVVAGNRRLSFTELEGRANAIAHALAARGVRPGDHVGAQLYNGSEYLEVMLACFKLRAVPVNLNYRYVADELEYLYQDADLVAVVHHRSLASVVAEARRRLPRVATAIAVEDGSAHEALGDAEDYESMLASSSRARDFPARSADDTYVLYTGGTTGMPKGVVWRQEDIVLGALLPLALGDGPLPDRPEAIALRACERRDARTLIVAPLMHGAAQWATCAAWFNGGGVVLWCARHLDAPELWRLAACERVASLQVVGDAMAQPLAEALVDAEDLDLSSLRVLLSGGAILSDIAKQKLLDRLPTLRIYDGFGASETGAQGTYVGRGGEGSPRFRVPSSTAVLDDALRPVDPGSGVRGRVARTGHIPLGYHKDPRKTAETFPVDAEGRRWVIPGDFATVEADGTVTVFGRGSVSINTGGEKVFPEEVELALRSHPDVRDAVVVGVADSRFGERVAAVVEPRSGSHPTLGALAVHARERIASFKLPRELHLVERMVRSPSGKPDYRWARRVALGQEPGPKSRDGV